MARNVRQQAVTGERTREAVGALAHGVRTPLTSIKGNVRLLRRSAAGLDENARTAMLEDVESAAEQLQDALEDVVFLSRQNDELVPETEPVLLQRIQGNVESDFHRSRPD